MIRIAGLYTKSNSEIFARAGIVEADLKRALVIIAESWHRDGRRNDEWVSSHNRVRR